MEKHYQPTLPDIDRDPNQPNLPIEFPENSNFELSVPLQLETPWSTEDELKKEILEYISKLDEKLNRMEARGDIDPRTLMEFTDLWDFAINQGWTNNNELEIAS